MPSLLHKQGLLVRPCKTTPFKLQKIFVSMLWIFLAEVVLHPLLGFVSTPPEQRQWQGGGVY